MFDPLATIQLGPLQLTVTMITYVITAITFYAVLRLLLQNNEENERESILNQVSTMYVIFLIVYKLWPFVFTPSLLLDFRNLIYYAGGPGAIVGASTISLVFFLFQWFRKGWSTQLVDRISITIFSGLIIHALLLKEMGQFNPLSFGWNIDDHYVHPVNLYETVLFSIFLFFSIQWTKDKGTGKITILLIIGFILTKALLAPFQIK
ncbi:hypothetical protein [Alkalihalobacterium alkalinitrilicum]|uniref:hypothetical protein n=1 Tax=Alkalihalobacterium alkalinitrilicum TaxID=427920 RepID=UPI000995195B|nr:hypothetical protein [Alkalihalobacterium alkalinitrilicum]